MGKQIEKKCQKKKAPKLFLRDLFGHSAKSSPLLLTLLALTLPYEAHSTHFVVNDAGDYSEAAKEAPKKGTLRDAIRRINKEPGPHTIAITTSEPIQLRSSLPPISAKGVEIIGRGSAPAVIDGRNQFSLGAQQHNLELSNVTLKNFAPTNGSSNVLVVDTKAPQENSTTLTISDFHVEKGGTQGADVFLKNGSTLNVKMATKDMALHLDGDQGSAKTGGLNVTGSGKTLHLTADKSSHTGNLLIGSKAKVITTSDASLGALTNRIEIKNGTLQTGADSVSSRVITISEKGVLAPTGTLTLNTPSLIQDGDVPGTLVLEEGTVHFRSSTPSTYSGGTVVGNNQITAVNDNVFGSGPIHFVEGTTSSLIYENKVDASRSFHVSGNATIVAPKDSSFSGPISGEGQVKLKSEKVALVSHPETIFDGHVIADVAVLNLSGNNPIGTKGTLHLASNTDSSTLQLQSTTIDSPIKATSQNVVLEANSGQNKITGSIEGGTNISYSSSGGQLAVIPAKNNSGLTGSFTIANAPLQTSGNTPLGVGELTLRDGTLEMLGNTQLKNEKVVIEGTSKIIANSGTVSTFAPTTRFEGNGALSLAGPGEIAIKSSQNQLNGSVTLQEGIFLNVTGNNPLNSIPLTVAQNQTATVHLVSQTSLDNSLVLGAHSTTTIVTDAFTENAITKTVAGDATTKLVVSGDGSLRINSSNPQFVGTMTLDSGILVGSGHQPFGSGSLELEGGAVHIKGESLLANRLIPDQDTTITSSSPYTVSGSIQKGSGALTFAGGGAVSLTGNNSDYEGKLTVPSGALHVQNPTNLGNSTLHLENSSLTIDGSGTFANKVKMGPQTNTIDIGTNTVAWNGTLFGAGGKLHVKGTDGVLTLGGNNSSMKSGWIVENITVEASADHQLGQGLVTLQDATLSLMADGSYSNPILSNSGDNSIQVNGHASLIELTGAAPLSIKGSGTLDLQHAFAFEGTTSLEGATTLHVEGKNPLGKNSIAFKGGALKTTGESSFTNAILLEQASAVIAVEKDSSAQFSGLISGVGGISYDSPEGTLDIRGENSYTGGTTLRNGTLATSGNAPLGTGPVHHVGGSHLFKDNGKYNNDFVLEGNRTISLNKNSSSTISGVISGDAVTFRGPGSVQLTNANIQQGLTLDGSTVIVNKDQNLGAAGAHLSFAADGGDLYITSPITFSDRLFTLDGYATLHIPVGLSTIQSTITGSGHLAVVGTGETESVLAITAPASHANTTLKGSTLLITDNGSLGQGKVVFAQHEKGKIATLNLAKAANYANKIDLQTDGHIVSPTVGETNTLSGAIRGLGALYLSGPGNFELTANNNGWFSGLHISEATLISDQAHQLGKGTLTFSNEAGLHLAGNSAIYQQPISLQSISKITAENGTVNTIAGVISGPGGLVFAGPGTVRMIGQNYYTGPTSLDKGRVQVGGVNPLGTGLLSFNGGDFELVHNTDIINPVELKSNGAILSDKNFIATFSGPISGTGALTLKTAGTVILTGDNSYSGGTTLTKGRLQVAGDRSLGLGRFLFDGGELELAKNSTLHTPLEFLTKGSIHVHEHTNSTLKGILSGSGNFTKRGAGTLRLAGDNTLTGETEIAEGRLVVNGSLPSSNIKVNKHTVLSGTGRVDKVKVYGTLEPGEGVGTLTANNVVFKDGSLFNPRCQKEGTSQLQADKIVVEGYVTLNPYLDPFLPETYKIATGKMDGKSFILGYSGSAMFPVTLAERNNALFLTVSQTDPSEIFTNCNLLAIANCYQELPPSADLTAVNAVLNLLTVPAYVSAFSQFDPAFYNALAYVQESAAYRVRAIYTAHAQNRRFEHDANWGVWGTGFGESIHQHKLGSCVGESGYDNHLSGFVSGIDVWALDQILVTGGFSYGHSAVHWNQAKALASVKSYTGFVGATWFTPNLSVDGFMSYTYHSANGSRKIYVSPTNLVTPPINSPIPFELFQTPIDRKLAQTSEANSGTFHLGGQYAYPLSWGVSLLSFANLDYFIVGLNGFQEKRGGVLDLAMTGKSSDLLRPEIGLGAEFVTSVPNATLFANTTISYVRECRFTGKGTQARFVGNTCQFKVYGLFPQQNLVSTNVEVGVSTLYGLNLSLNYFGTFGSHYVSNGGQLELTYLF